MTTDHTNDETPEAPPAREPDICDFCVEDEYSGPNPWCVHRKKGPRIDPPSLPTEPPILPHGWTSERSVHGAIPEDIPCTCYDGFDGDYVTVMDDGRVHADAMVDDLRRILGLTAPAADVRAALAVLEEALKRQSMSTLNYATDVSALRCAITEALRLLTGKGAPL